MYSIAITNGGSGYTSVPTVSITGDGSGATAVAQISGDNVVGIQITAYGSGYTSSAVSFSGGGGTGAAATATLQSVTPQLVSETLQELPQDDPRRSLYVIILRQYEALPGPILIEHRYEPFINNYVSIKKSVVPKSMVPADMYYVTRVAGEITEYSPITEWRYIKCVSKINTAIAWENGGDDEVYYGTAPYSFPNEIPVAPTVTVFYASQGSRLVIDFGWNLDVIEGYSGACPARFTRRYTFDPTDAAFIADLPTVTYIHPQAHVVNDGFVYVGENLIAQATQFNLPSALHPELTIVADVDGLGPITPTPEPIEVIPATIPSTIPEGDYIVASVRPIRWQFGLWVYDITEIQNPVPPP